MNNQVLKGNWNEVKGKLKSTWGKLTDNDLKEIEGNQQQLFGKLQKYYGYTKDDIQRKIDNDFNY